MNNAEKQKYSTAAEVAALWDTKPAQIYEWVRNGTIPPGCFFRIGKKVLFDLEALQQWMKRGGSAGNTQTA